MYLVNKKYPQIFFDDLMTDIIYLEKELAFSNTSQMYYIQYNLILTAIWALFLCFV